MKKILTTILLALTIATSVAQEISLPALWGNNAVLKQNSDVVLRGWAHPTSKISIVASWNRTDTIVVTTRNTGKFEAMIKTPAGSYRPQTITFNGKPLMENILIGEVWICSGQSNMQWNVNNGIKDGEQHAKEANHEYIRLFTIPLSSAETPQDDLRASWTVSTPQTMRRTSAVGYFFARELEKNLGVPVGIIVNAWGGAPAEAYTPSERVYGNAEIANNIFMDPTNVWRDDRPGKVYNAMVAPLQPYTVSGVIWYQGETNVPKWHVYDKLMKALIEGWRENFKQEMPFYIAQIAPFNYGNNLESAPLRIMQERVAKQTTKSGIIALSDLVNDVNNIHPTDKLSVGERFAALAMAQIYGKSIAPYKYPSFKEMQVLKGGKIIVSFDNLVGNLTLPEGSNGIIGLTVTDKNGNSYPAIGKIKGAKLEVTAKGVKEPKAVRYCYDNTTIGNIFSSEMLPLMPFNSELK